MIVIDTHIWFWWIVDPDRLSPAATTAIDGAPRIGLSAYSVYELARAHAAGRAELDHPDWIARARRFDQRMVELPVDAEVGVRAVELLKRGLTGDPGDQIILATAQLANADLITADRRLAQFAPAQTIW